MTADSPYKFLDSYDVDDAPLFFGREREVRVLVADVVVSRLVVLFAHTGTGKTSLINAGVRPVLAERDYETYFIRVEQDPERSARQAIPCLPAVPGDLAADLAELAAGHGRPVVLFFDQFEEFFLYAMRADPERARAFVSDIARVYEDEASGVHVVFSMREEFFVEMDVFRDDIPTIFQAESNLRLRWFAPEQARVAIVEPARITGVEIEPGLVERLIADLSTTGARLAGSSLETPIEPAQLQIVCDALWARRRDGVLRLDAYEALGTAGRGNVAEQVLDARLADEFAKIDRREQLDLLDRLLLELRTEEGTKWVRELRGLASALETDEGTLDELIDHLTRSHLVERLDREGVTFVELVHDYLADEHRIERLRRAVRVAWPGRQLAAALHEGRLLHPPDVRDVAVRLGELDLTPEEGELLLRSALGHGAALEPMLSAIERSGAAVWDVLAERVRDADAVEAQGVVDAVSPIDRPEAAGILERALDREDLALDAVSALGRSRTAEAVRILAARLDDEELGEPAREALSRLAASRGAPDAARRASEALTEHLSERGSAEGLGAVDSVVAVDALVARLGDPAVADDARDALRALTGSTHREVAVHAYERLMTDLERRLVAGRLGDADIPMITSLEGTRSVALLARLAEDPSLVAGAEAGLRLLLRSDDTATAAAAESALDRRSRVSSEAVRGRAAQPAPAAEPDPELERTLARVARSLTRARVIPFLGNGANLAGRPTDAPWKPGAPLTAYEFASRLADEFDYPTDEPMDLALIAQYVGMTFGSGPLYDVIGDAVRSIDQVGPVHRLLARLPAVLRDSGTGEAPLIGSVLWDTLMERALTEAGEPFDVLMYRALGPDAGSFILQPFEGEPVMLAEPNVYKLERDRTVVLKLHGGVNDRDRSWDSFVVAEDDHIAYLQRDPVALLPVGIRARLRAAGFLFLGYGLRDWTMRTVLSRIWSEQELGYRSWAVLRAPSPLDRSYWQSRDVALIDAELRLVASVLHELLPAG